MRPNSPNCPKPLNPPPVSTCLHYGWGDSKQRGRKYAGSDPLWYGALQTYLQTRPFRPVESKP